MNRTQQMSLGSALEELARTPVAILAGGTDFYPALQDKPTPDNVLDITRIAGLRTIEKNADGWSIGAGSTWTDVINACLPPAFDGLKAAAHEVGSVQIQNAATVAGNLCNASPAADGVPPLLALNARIELASVRGRRTVSLQDFILGPRKTARQADELMVAIHIPPINESAIGRFSKLGSRRYLVISIVMACIVLDTDEQGNLTDVRIAVGACSAVAQRLEDLEQMLLNYSIHTDLVSMVTPSMFSSLTPIDDIRGSGDYRLAALHQMVNRLLSSCVHDARALLSSNARRIDQGGDFDGDQEGDQEGDRDGDHL